MSIEYQVIYNINIDKFHKDVRIQLDNGWTLQGGVTLDQGYFCQAMVKEKEPDIPKDVPAGATKVDSSLTRATVKKKVVKRGRPRKVSQ